MDSIKLNVPEKEHGQGPAFVQPQKAKKPKNNFLSKLEKPLDYLVKAFIFMTVFLIPLVFSPATYDVIELPKMTFLGIFVLLGLIFWLCKMFAGRNFNLKRTPLDIPILLFGAIYLIASLVSISPLTSVIGFYGRLNGSFLAVLFFIIFYYLVVNNINTKKEVMGITLTLIMSTILVSVYGLLQIYGIYILPSELTKSKGFTTVGTLNALAVFIMAVIPITTALALRKANEARLSFAGTSALLFIVLILINVKAAWWGLLAAGIVLLVLPLVDGVKKTDRKWLLLPGLIALLSLSFIFTSSFGNDLPKEITLGQSEAYKEVKQAVKERPVFGSGLDTYSYNFSKFRSAELNNQENWSLRFDKSSNEWFNSLATNGLAGIAVTLLLVVLASIAGVMNYRRSKDEDMKYITLGALAAVIAISVMNLFYFNSFSILMVFWLALALIGIARKTTEVAADDAADLNLRSASFEAKVFSSVFFVILFAGAFYGLYFMSKSYAADAKYSDGLEKTNQESTLNEAQKDIEKAISLNPQREAYRLSLARIHLVQANLENQKEEKDKDVKKIQEYLSKAIDQGKQAVNTNPQSVSNWEGMIIIYRNAALYATGAIDWIEKSYQEALKLEPTNPVLVNGLGQVYLTKNELDKAEEHFNKALSLKTEFADPYFNLGVVYKEKKEYAKAIASFEKYLSYVPDSEDAKKEIENVKKLQAGGRVTTEDEALKGQPPVDTDTTTENTNTDTTNE
jgi:putative inorganic carbon (HCO3(-)) transporter